MRKYIIPIIAVLLTAVSCQKENFKTDALSAARQIYNEYADVDGLTVALIGNYATKGDTINAVMIQAQNNEAWASLLEEFGVEQQAEEGASVSSLSVNYFHVDTIIGDMDEYFDEILHSLTSELPHYDSSIIVRKHQSWEKGMKIADTTIVETETGFSPNERLIGAAVSDHQTGYITHAESDEMTLWLFFYSNESQYRSIMDRINDR
jgi:hypothetical protein